MAEASPEMLYVVVLGDEEAEHRLYYLPSSTTVGEVSVKWLADSQADAPCALRCHTGQLLDDGQELWRVSEVIPGSQVLLLFVETLLTPVEVDRGEECVTVRLENGERTVLRLSGEASIGELRKAVSVKEGKTRLRLVCEGELLTDDSAPVRRVVDGRDVQVEAETAWFVVLLDDGSVRWKVEAARSGFREFAHQLAAKSGRRWEEVMRQRFQCVGCGRVVSSEEEGFQWLPGDCCRVRSLRLRELAVKKERGTQAESWLSISEPVPPVLVDAETQTRAATAAPLTVFNDIRWLGKPLVSFVDLTLTDKPSGREVRMALANWLGLNPDQIVVSRLVVFRDGVPLFHNSGNCGYFFSSADGNKHVDLREMKWYDKWNRPIADEMEFQMVPNQRNFVRVSTAPLQEFFIDGTVLRMFDHQYLPVNVDGFAGEVKAALAWIECVQASPLTLWRLVGLIEGREVFGVKNRHRREWIGFADDQGNEFDTDIVKDVRWRQLDDQEKFKIVPERYNVMKVEKKS